MVGLRGGGRTAPGAAADRGGRGKNMKETKYVVAAPGAWLNGDGTRLLRYADAQTYTLARAQRIAERFGGVAAPADGPLDGLHETEAAATGLTALLDCLASDILTARAAARHLLAVENQLARSDRASSNRTTAKRIIQLLEWATEEVDSVQPYV